MASLLAQAGVVRSVRKAKRLCPHKGALVWPKREKKPRACRGFPKLTVRGNGLEKSRCSSSLLKNPRQNESSLIQFFYHESVEARMRGVFMDQGQLFSYISPEARVRTDHPLRKIRKLVRDVLGELNRSLSRLYASEGRPSIPPEQLLSALLLQVFYGIRSERQLMEQLDY